MAKRIIDYYNLFVGAFVTIAAAILGEHWYLFAAFLALNVVDWVALRKESVDRNNTSRRIIYSESGRSPQGERG